MSKINKKIIIATGGTGGHVLPAVGLANYLNKIGFQTSITTDLRGTKYIDMSTIKEFKIIGGSRLNKKNFLFSLIKIFLAFLKSLLYLMKVKPKFIFGMGGYASFPVCMAAIFLRVPFIIYENNLLVGRANRILLPFAKKIFISYKEVAGIKTQYTEKKVVIGNIIREQILNNENIINDEPLTCLNILVLGGSQAAKVFAEILPKIFIKCCKQDIELKIFQQCLPEQISELKKIYKTNNLKNELFSFTFDIIKYYKIANLAITRAGSSALAELLNCRLPMIMVPLKLSAENHQFKNAQYFENKGYGIMLEESNVEKKLFDLLKNLNNNKKMIIAVKENQKKYSDKKVFIYIKDLITNLFYEN